MVVSIRLNTGSLYAKVSLNIPLFTFGHNPFIYIWGGRELGFLTLWPVSLSIIIS